MAGNPNPVCKFKKGNPGGGRKPGSVSLTTLLKKMAEREIEYSDEDLNKIAGDNAKKRKVAELINLRLLALATKGKDWAVKEFWDRMEGTAKQTVDMNVKNGKFEEFAELTDEEVLAQAKARLKGIK